MPLDDAVAPKSLTSTLHYLERGTEKPASYPIEPPAGVPRWNGIDDPREVTIEDARGRESEFTLDRNGFALIKAPTAVADFMTVAPGYHSTPRSKTPWHQRLRRGKALKCARWCSSLRPPDPFAAGATVRCRSLS